jgi:carboxymethylenebutenolidase
MPSIDFEAVWDDHSAQEFVHQDVNAAMRSMTDDVTVNHVAVMTGGSGRDAVFRFYRDHFVGQSPADLVLEPVSRTVGADGLVDEFVCRFTHDMPMDWLLPGVAPTGCAVRLPVVAVIRFDGGRIAAERIYWDQASLLVQVGVLDRANLPITGAEAADRVLDPSLPANGLIRPASTVPLR